MRTAIELRADRPRRRGDGKSRKRLASSSSLSDWGFVAGDLGELKRLGTWNRLQARLRGGIWVASRTLALLAAGCLAAVQAGARTNIRLRFHAIVTRLHSPRTLSRPRSKN